MANACLAPARGTRPNALGRVRLLPSAHTCRTRAAARAGPERPAPHYLPVPHPEPRQPERALARLGRPHAALDGEAVHGARDGREH